MPRRSSQKPADALLANFRQQFPELNTTSSASPTQAAVAPVSAADNPLLDAAVSDEYVLTRSSSVCDHGTLRCDVTAAPDELQLTSRSSSTNLAPGPAFQQDEPTPRASNEPWRLTPSFMDPNSFNFNQFANAPPGYYTPTPGGTNTLFHPQAGDLHTPVGMAVPGLGTPLSMPNSGTIHTGAGVVDMGGFQPLAPHQMHHFNPFVQAQPPPPQAFAPSSFVHQDTGYETMEQDGSPMQPNRSEDRMTSIDSAIHSATAMNFQPGQLPQAMEMPPNPENFRFASTLHAPTAMIKNTDEIPVTYLNKGQAYQLAIRDRNSLMPIAPGTKYRTFVRISFEDEEQRQKPGVCWSLWKEGRGANEAHQRGGKLQAVEFVEAGQPAEGDDKRTRVELESSSFDGFSVIWTPGTMMQGAEVNVAVRFNFLSTDFSHSKGVKGIPVRLCSKTNIITDGTSQTPVNPEPEICFCKVKLFRDHGAERKLSNDVAHVKKSIDKVKHQIAQAENGMKDFGKRKRGGTKLKVDPSRGGGKVPKHKRTWSLSSADSGENTGRTTAENDLHIKLQTLQEMFSSTRPLSALYLRGEEQDDPDAHPVTLVGESGDTTSEPGAQFQSRPKRASNADTFGSQSPSSFSLASGQSASVPGTLDQNYEGRDADGDSGDPSERPTKVRKTESGGKPSGWIEALGVDQTYQPPPERIPKPVACFYIRLHNKNDMLQHRYHNAVYLLQRSLKDFNRRVAKKFGLEHARIQRTIHVLQSGLEVEMDDDVVRHLSEAQEMVLEVEELDASVKQEWEMAVDGTPTQETPNPPVPRGLVLRLTF